MNLILWSLATILIYLMIRWTARRLNQPLFNPILMSILVLIFLLLLTGKNYQVYAESTQWISFLLGPVVVMLALPLYRNRAAIYRYRKAISVGILTSMMSSFGMVWLLTKLFQMNRELYLSLLPKSITTPMAIEVTGVLGGNPGFTVIFVILTGVIGATVAPWVMKGFKIKHDMAKGIGIGASSHGVGTSKAIEMGEAIGAASGLAMGIAGVSTVLLFMLVLKHFL